MSRRPLQLSVNDLRNRLGQRRDFSIDVDLEPLTVISSRTTADPVVGMVVLESISRGVSAVGSVNFSWESECRRCLKVLSGKSDAPIDEIFQVDAPGNSEIIPFDGEHLDLMPVVRDSVFGVLPLSPLCSDECQGPDPDRYPALSEEEVEALAAAEPKTDPRWAALEGLNLDLG